MTTGYFTEEKDNEIIMAAKLSGDAYLDGGYGEEVLAAYQRGNARAYLKSLMKEMPPEQRKEVKQIIPEWYRKTKYTRPGDYVAEYGYVLKNDQLLVHQNGQLLFTADRSTIDRWLYVAQNLKQIEATYLYSEENLNMDYQKEPAMFSELSSKWRAGYSIKDLENELRPKDFIPMTLSDDHCVDVWNRPDAPAYIKTLQAESETIEFIVSKKYGKWFACLQLPYMRVQVLSEYICEGAAVKALRALALDHKDALVRFGEVCRYVRSIQKAIQDKADYNREFQRRKLSVMYEERPWFAADNHFGIDDILRELGDTWRRQQEKLKEHIGS